MAADQINFSVRSWSKVAQEFRSVGPEAGTSIGNSVAATTDAAACNSAGGLATIDAAITILLGTFQSVMAEVSTGISDAVGAESSAMSRIANSYARVEADNEATASKIDGG